MHLPVTSREFLSLAAPCSTAIFYAVATDGEVGHLPCALKQERTGVAIVHSQIQHHDLRYHMESFYSAKRPSEKV